MACARSALVPGLRVGALAAGIAYGSIRYAVVSGKVAKENEEAQKLAETQQQLRVEALQKRLAELEPPAPAAAAPAAPKVEESDSFFGDFLDGPRD